MKHEYSLAHLSVLMLPPPRFVEVAAAAGYDYVGLRINRVTDNEPLYDLANDADLMRETQARLADTGIRVLDIELARMPPDQKASMYGPLLETAAELGARNIIAQLPDPDYSRKVQRFADLCDLASPLGIKVNLEFPSWTETPDLESAATILREVDRDNAGMLIDVLHFGRSNSSLEQLAALPREWFNFAHICDAEAEVPTTTEGLIHTARAERLFPGEGGLDAAEILAQLPSDIPYALEIPRLSLMNLIGEAEYARVALLASKGCLDS